MGTWGYGNFDNDSAVDWLMDFAEESSEAKIRSAFNMIEDSDGIAESMDCEEALVAAEVVAQLCGSTSEDFPEEELEIINSSGFKCSPDLTVIAIEIIRKIKQNSELKELWDDSEEAGFWLEAVNELEQRLTEISR